MIRTRLTGHSIPYARYLKSQGYAPRPRPPPPPPPRRTRTDCHLDEGVHVLSWNAHRNGRMQCCVYTPILTQLMTFENGTKGAHLVTFQWLHWRQCRAKAGGHWTPGTTKSYTPVLIVPHPWPNLMIVFDLNSQSTWHEIRAAFREHSERLAERLICWTTVRIERLLNGSKWQIGAFAIANKDGGAIGSFLYHKRTLYTAQRMGDRGVWKDVADTCVTATSAAFPTFFILY